MNNVPERRLKLCPNCAKTAGELKKSESPTCAYRVECNTCGFMTGFVRLPGVVVKLWNEAKPVARERKQ